MKTYRVLLPAAVALVTLAACSSTDGAAPRPISSTSPPTTTSSVLPSPPAATTGACRTFAEDPAVDKIRQSIDSAAAEVDTTAVASALGTVFNLEVVAVRPGLDATVANVMEASSEASTRLRDRWVQAGSINPGAFNWMVDNVHSACELAGVPMP